MAHEEAQNTPEFPVYRKYPGGKTYFKVYSYDYFEEFKQMGNFYEVHTYQAAILPDRNLIEDMIALRDNYWEKATEAEFYTFKNYCETSLTPLSGGY